MPRRLKCSSEVEKLFIEILEDIIRAHRFVSNPVWAISYDEEAFIARKKREKRARRKIALRRLNNQKLLTTKWVGRNIIITLSDHGQHERLRLLVAKTRKRLPKNTVCLVSFDIPETARIIRRAFRNLLKFGRFKQLHQSVWVCQFDVAEIIQEFIDQTSSKDWIAVFNSSKV